MTDEELDKELVEALRQTFHEKADALKPSPGWAPSPRPRSRRLPRPGRRLALASLATAVAAAAAAAIVVLNDHPSPAHNVSIAGPSSTVSTPAAAKPTTATSAPASSTPSTAPPTTAPTAAPPIPVPAGFQPQSVTFISAHTGWVLGTAPCGTSVCTVLVRTSDGGATWTEVSQPPVAVNPYPNGGTRVRFLNLDIGWIVASSGSQAGSLWTTSDGGKDWAQEPNPGGASATVLALEASDGVVHLVDLEPGTGTDRIFTSPVGRQDWQASPAAPSFGAGPVPSSQMILLGSAGWIVNVNRTVVGGARLSASGWTDWTPPCSDAHGPGYVAASSISTLYAVCAEGVWGTPAPGTTANSEWLYASTDGGNTFSPVGPLPGASTGGNIAVAPGTATVVAATATGMVATFDGGQAWQTVSSVAGVTYLGFTTATQGVAISEQANGSSPARATMLVTRDGGHTWVPVAF